MLEFISKPWPWYVAGPIIALVMSSLLFFGRSFGLSSNLRTICSILGAGKHCEFFDFNWRDQLWNLVFAFGLVLGGWIASNYLTAETAVAISPATIQELQSYGLENVGDELLPTAIFSWDSLATWRGFTMLIVGGFLIGFGTRYAGGCTSGHAISGLSNLQRPSLIAVIGFFIGGLFATYFIIPSILTL